MITTRAMSTSCGNQRDIAGIGGGGANGDGISTGCNDQQIGAADDAQATGSIATIIKTRMTITSDPGILCFHHCNVKVFCFTLPHICPQCKRPLDTQHPNGTTINKRQAKNKKRFTNANDGIANTKEERNHHSNNVNADNVDSSYGINADDQDYKDNDNNDCDENENDDDDDDDDDNDDDNENSFVSHIMSSRLLPFRLPYPFVRANQYPCAIVLRPTTGDFLNDYNNTTDLHIAVTTSTGCVVEFDRHGLRRHRTDNMSDWWQSLLVGDVPEPWYDYWDQVLFEICQEPNKWTVSHYHEDKHNCYTFVLTFLQALTYDKLSEAASSKTTFCEKYIVPRTTTAGKYISLYRKLRDTGIYVHHTNHHHNKLRLATSYAKGGNKRQQQQQQQQQQQNNKLNNTGTAVQQRQHLNQQQQQQHQKHQHMQLQQPQQQKQQHHHSNHHYSIKSRPHSTLCTIEE